VLQPPPPGYDEDASEDDEDDSAADDDSSDAASSDDSDDAASSDDASSSEDDDSLDDDSSDDEAAAAAAKESLEHYAEARKEVLASQQELMSNGGNLLRSKGFCWLASCPDRVVEWSSSGLLLEVALTHPWFCTVPEVRILLRFVVWHCTGWECNCHFAVPAVVTVQQQGSCVHANCGGWSSSVFCFVGWPAALIGWWSGAAAACCWRWP
jgi:hypothetical protein